MTIGRKIPDTKWVWGYDARRTEAVVVERVRELAATLTDRRIAEQLNQERSRPAEGRYIQDQRSIGFAILAEYNILF